LPAGVRQQILEALQQQLGGAEYRRLVNVMGEDGVIECVLQQMALARRALQSPPAAGGPGGLQFSPHFLGLERPRRFRMLSAKEVAAAAVEATLYTFALPSQMFGFDAGCGLLVCVILCVFGWIALIAASKGEFALLALVVWLFVFVWRLIETFCTRR
jgi:hypothetical protein